MNRRLAKLQLAVWTKRMNRRSVVLAATPLHNRKRTVRVYRVNVAHAKVDELRSFIAAHPAPAPKPTMRERGLEWCTWAVANNARIHYLQRRPMHLAAMVGKQLDLSIDCSESTTGAYKYAGAPDPNGRGYDGAGNTACMRAHLPRIPLSAILPFDIIVYGPNDVTRQHVCIVLEPGPDPLMFSHGQEAGPFKIRHSVEVAAHGGVYTAHRGIPA